LRADLSCADSTRSAWLATDPAEHGFW